jgi:opacity protein-like surface antigen
MAPTKLCFAGSQNQRSELKSRPGEFAAYAFLINNLRKARGKTLGHYCSDVKALAHEHYRRNTTNPGLPSYFNSQNLNGGGGQVTFFITPNIGLAGDLQGYGSYTQWTKPGAIIQGCASGNLYNAFSLAVCGGVDFAVTEKITIRIVDADYVLTRFGNNFTGGNNSQSNFRFQTGVQFRF